MQCPICYLTYADHTPQQWEAHQQIYKEMQASRRRVLDALIRWLRVSDNAV